MAFSGAEKSRRWRERHPDRSVSSVFRWQAKNPEKHRRHDRKYLLKKFGLTIEQYDEMLEKQNGVCWICNKPESGKELAVDHCHVSKRNRALLCQRCNRAIGLLGDDIPTIQSCIDYLMLESAKMAYA